MTPASETGVILADTVERIFRDQLDDAGLRASRAGGLPDFATAILEAGLTLALVREDSGGFGVEAGDALPLIHIAAKHGAPAPLAETLIANWLLDTAGLAPAGGWASFALAPDVTLVREGGRWRCTGEVKEVAWGRQAGTVALAVGDHLVRLDAPAEVRDVPGVGGLPRATLGFDVLVDDAQVAPLGSDLLACGAAMRTVEIAGAVGQVLAMTVAYVSDRVQFGKPLVRQQAVQQQLAVLAEQSAAAAAAAEMAIAVFGRAHGLDAIAAAKSRAGEAAGVAAGIAHQLHGAIGFTEEHRLHYLTRALWGWRDEFGCEADWNAHLGRKALAAGGGGLWPLVTATGARTDDADLASLRAEVRAFAREALADRPVDALARSWSVFDADFSRRLGELGWIGMTWPRTYGGHERSAAERYVVIEELLAAGAPVAAHWFADRQTGPLLLKFGSEAQRRRLLPGMAAGAVFTCIGMSEPDAGSDLAAVRTRAEPVEGGFRVNGTKLWTTYGHKARYMVLFCRTSGSPADRAEGTSQLLVDLTGPGITIRPVIDLAGEHHFNEVVFEDALVPTDALIGQAGQGWPQIMSELAYERSGPERFLSSMVLFAELVSALGPDGPPQAIGRLMAHLVALRRMSLGVADLLARDEDPALQAAMVKDLGAVFEQEIPDIARQLCSGRETPRLRAALTATILGAPAYSLRGGAREILRGIIARGLGAR